jgi:hypothetical protein
VVEEGANVSRGHDFKEAEKENEYEKEKDGDDENRSGGDLPVNERQCFQPRSPPRDRE